MSLSYYIRKRFNNAYILGKCILFAFQKGRAQKEISNPKKILIFQPAQMGDMVCTTPLFRAVKRQYPQVHLYVMGKAINKELLVGNEDIDEYLVYSSRLSSIINMLQGRGIDFACVTSPNFLPLAALYLTGIPCIAVPKITGFSPYETKSFKILRHLAITKPHRMGHYAPKEYLRLLEPIGISTDDTKKHLVFSKDANLRINNLFQEHNVQTSKFIVGIAPSAGNKIKMWGRDKFAQVADHIYQKYNAQIVILGGNNDKNEVQEMLKHLDPETKVINFQGLLSIEELKAVISHLNLLISVDSGPIYIAEAFSVPTIDIVGPIDENEQPPIGKLHRIVKANRKKPELYVMNARMYNREEAQRQTNAITVEMVINEFEDLFKLLKS